MMMWKSVLLGALTFLATHLVETQAWSWFDPGAAVPPWFLNAGRAMGFTAACLLVAAAIDSAVAASSRHQSLMRGGNLAAGAFAAMTIVLFANGPGTLFPIALAFGAILAALSSLAGAFVGWGLVARGRGPEATGNRA